MSLTGTEGKVNSPLKILSNRSMSFSSTGRISPMLRLNDPSCMLRYRSCWTNIVILKRSNLMWERVWVELIVRKCEQTMNI